MNKYSTEPINFGMDTVICNLLREEPWHIKNFICLVTKQYIYRQRCQKETLSIEQLITLIVDIKRFEKMRALETNNLLKHCKKWGETPPPHLSITPAHGKNDNCYVEEYVNNIIL